MASDSDPNPSGDAPRQPQPHHLNSRPGSSRQAVQPPGTHAAGNSRARARSPSTPTWRAAVLLGGCLVAIPFLSAASLRASAGDTPVTRQNRHPRADEAALAWSLLGTLGLTFGVVTACGWSIRRHQRRSGPDAALLHELLHPGAPPIRRTNGLGPPMSSPSTNSSSKKPEPSAPWERPADWWRQDFHQD